MKLKQRKIEIIDTTLITLWENYRCSFKRNINKIMELIKLVYIAGADYIEITDELYRFMLKLPENVEFILDYYKSIEIKGVDELKENIMIFENNKKIKRLRIIGLDNLILSDYEDILYEVIEKLEDRVELSITDKYKCSTGIAVEWIRLGGKKIVTSFAGIAGNTPLEELLGALRYIENINIRGDFRVFKKISKLYEEITCT
ncbi:MAG: homocitrate synthase, partial [Clostridium butyricum]